MKTKLLLLFLFALFENTQAQTRFITKVLDAYPVKLIKTQDNNFLVACEGDTALNIKNRGFYLLKYNKAGELLWKQEHHLYSGDTLFEMWDVLEANNGNIFSVGRFYKFWDTISNSVGFIAEFDSFGNFLRIIKRDGSKRLRGVIQKTDSTLIVGCNLQNDTGKLLLYNLQNQCFEDINTNFYISGDCCSNIFNWADNNKILANSGRLVVFNQNFELVLSKYFSLSNLKKVPDGILSSGYFGVLKLDQNLDTSLYLSVPFSYTTLGPAMECSNGDILVTGRWDYMYWYFPFIWRINSQGETVYMRSYQQTGPFEVLDVLEDDDGGIVMLFYNSDYNNEQGYDTGLWLYKTNQWGWLLGADGPSRDESGFRACYDKNNAEMHLTNLPHGAATVQFYNVTGMVVANHKLSGQLYTDIPLSLVSGYYTVAVLNKSGSILASYKTIIY